MGDRSLRFFDDDEFEKALFSYSQSSICDMIPASYVKQKNAQPLLLIANRGTTYGGRGSI